MNFDTYMNENKLDIAYSLLESAKIVPRFNERIEGLGDNLSSFVEDELICLVDYLVALVSKGEESFGALYIGEKAKMAYEPGATALHRYETIKKLLLKDKEIILDHIGESVFPEQVEMATKAFDALLTDLNNASGKELSVLFIGDCLFLDVVSFLTGHLAKRGVMLTPHFMTEKNPIKIKMDLAKLDTDSFDIVFYSPLSYDFNNDFSKLVGWKNALLSSRKRKSIVDKIFNDISPVISQLASQFSIPIFIHNTAAVIRSETSDKHIFIRNLATQHNRTKARELVDKKLSEALTDNNNRTYKHLYKFDEQLYLETTSVIKLGEFFYHSKLQHPAKIGALIAKSYDIICDTYINLLKKKLIVCDLDNTLWDGIIGEGKVSHHIEKQNLLKRLKNKGVVLAIASKNDPKNIHWDGGVLNDDDFVFKHINWAPKIGAFPKMQASLNLKMKDFVFIDDRVDERLFVKKSYPEINVLDALDTQTWNMFAIWESMLDEKGAKDRTQLYLERAKRNDFVQDNKTAEASEEELFGTLGLKISIKDATIDDLPRATELINRTNQFNMQGSRTSLSEMKKWHNSPTHHIITTNLKDNFGDMGCVSVLVAEEQSDTVTVSIFVLSCRVFGFKVETAILNKVKSIAAEKHASVTGIHTETMYNGPCKNTYEENGFTLKDAHWNYEISDAAIPNPTWMEFIE